MRENILVKTNTLANVIQWHYDGATQMEIVKRLQDEFGVKISQSQISNILKRAKETTPMVAKIKESTEPSAQDILYANRQEVVRMKREFYINSAIAKKFGVKESDVIEFLSKRKKLTPEQHREILYKYSQGAEPEDIANEFGVNIKTIETILSKNKVLTTSPQVMAKVKEKQDEEIKTELYDPAICKDFIKFINNIQTRYKYYNDDLQGFDSTRNDIYHKLEMCDLSQDEQLELLNQIKEKSVERRKIKDFIEVTRPIIEFLNDEDNRKVIQAFGNVVGMTMNNLKKLDTRVYFLREEK